MNNEQQNSGRDGKEKQIVGATPQKKQNYFEFPINLIPANVIACLEGTTEMDFNCFELEKITKGEELPFFMIYLFHT